MITLTDAVSKTSVAVNPEFVVAVFQAVEGEHAGKTIIGLVNGNLIAEESYLDVVGLLQGAK